MHLGLVGKYSHKTYNIFAISIPERKTCFYKSTTCSNTCWDVQPYPWTLVKIEKTLKVWPWAINYKHLPNKVRILWKVKMLLLSDHSSERKLHEKKSKQTKLGLNSLNIVSTSKTHKLVEKNSPQQLEKKKINNSVSLFS